MATRTKLWTRATVDRVLPLVRSYSLGIMQDFARLRRAGRAAKRMRELHGIDWPGQADHPVAATSGDLVAVARELGDARLARVQERIRDAAVRIDVAAAELEADLGGRGVTLRDYEHGRFDFPAMENGRPLYLCWQPTDGPAVVHAHEPDKACPARPRTA